MKKRALAMLFLLLLQPAYAEIEAKKGQSDDRVREVVYNPNDIVRIQTYFGVRSMIRFPQEEKIIDFQGGDDAAWDIPEPRNKNYLFVKPLHDNPDMNLIVITQDKKGVQRDYNFALKTPNKADKQKRPFETSDFTLYLRIVHPEDLELVQKNKSKAEEKNRIKDELNPGNHLSAQRDLNFDYWSCGDSLITPSSAYDDGQFIKLTFTNNKDIPSVHEVISNGTESLISHTMITGTTMVIPKLVRKLVLRKGEQVACVVNMSFDSESGIDNTTGTASFNVVRILKSQE